MSRSLFFCVSSKIQLVPINKPKFSLKIKKTWVQYKTNIHNILSNGLLFLILIPNLRPSKTVVSLTGHRFIKNPSHKTTRKRKNKQTNIRYQRTEASVAWDLRTLVICEVRYACSYTWQNLSALGGLQLLDAKGMVAIANTVCCMSQTNYLTVYTHTIKTAYSMKLGKHPEMNM